MNVDQMKKKNYYNWIRNLKNWRKILEPKEMVYMRWVDSTFQHGWLTEEEIETYQRYINTIGYVLIELPNSITICQNYSDNQYSGVTSIPRSAILEYKELKVKCDVCKKNLFHIDAPDNVECKVNDVNKNRKIPEYKMCDNI